MRKKKLVNILISVLPSIQIPLSDPPQSATLHPNATMDTRKQNLYSPDLLKTATTATKEFLALAVGKASNTTTANSITGMTGKITPSGNLTRQRANHSSTHGFLTTEDELS